MQQDILKQTVHKELQNQYLPPVINNQMKLVFNYLQCFVHSFTEEDTIIINSKNY